MIKINLHPQVRGDALTLTKIGDALVINGDTFDFADLPEGATLPALAVDCAYVTGDISRSGGDITVTLLLPITPEASMEARFPAPLELADDGEVVLPC